MLALLCCTSSSSKPGATSSPVAQATAEQAGNDIAAENAMAGTADWQITNLALNGEISGYAGQTSYARGETVDLHISTRTDGEAYSIALYRMGWYGGSGARLVKT